MNGTINKEKAIRLISADKVHITNDLLAVGGSKEVYEAINKTYDRHIKMLESLDEERGTSV